MVVNFNFSYGLYRVADQLVSRVGLMQVGARQSLIILNKSVWLQIWTNGGASTRWVKTNVGCHLHIWRTDQKERKNVWLKKKERNGKYNRIALPSTKFIVWQPVFNDKLINFVRNWFRSNMMENTELTL